MAKLRNSERAWAILRIALGQAQIVGAVATLAFLLRTGESWLTLVSTIITALLAATSFALFHSRAEERP